MCIDAIDDIIGWHATCMKKLKANMNYHVRQLSYSCQTLIVNDNCSAILIKEVQEINLKLILYQYRCILA